MRTPAYRRLLLAAMISAAPVQAQAVPDQLRPTLVFFDWGKPEINGDAAALLDAVAAAHAQRPNARLLLSGHSDRSGPPAHNLRSGKRRADAVRDYLAARGVPSAAMSTTSFGEERPIIATEDGVREAQNRRVEIRFGTAE